MKGNKQRTNQAIKELNQERKLIITFIDKYLLH
jgi:hypothetical protein